MCGSWYRKEEKRTGCVVERKKCYHDDRPILVNCIWCARIEDFDGPYARGAGNRKTLILLKPLQMMSETLSGAQLLSSMVGLFEEVLPDVRVFLKNSKHQRHHLQSSLSLREPISTRTFYPTCKAVPFSYYVMSILGMVAMRLVYVGPNACCMIRAGL